MAATYAKYNVIETPASETKILADLLGLTPEALGTTIVWFPDGEDITCASCARALTFLDVAETGLKVHTKEFMTDILTGKRGYVLNNKPQAVNCHGCGAAVRQKTGYSCRKYHCHSSVWE
ncbi:hypothetical protein C8R45DRAFT_1183968 [Mycena sanguinolenta]|nr:hypothetical protein C8R45DRAFT_1183968 [Mycena sanguinolenta]